MKLNKDNSLAEWVTTFPVASNIFQKYNLDFCCGGEQSLVDSCSSVQITPEVIIQEIEEAALVASHDTNWSELDTNEMITRILKDFHEKHREDLKMLIPLAQKVERVHHDKDMVPNGLSIFLQHLESELDSHMKKEEQVLFPMILSENFSMISAPIHRMIQEHHHHGQTLEELKIMANNYILPEGACSSWTTLIEGVKNLEFEIKKHIATENNILFPRVIKNSQG